MIEANQKLDEETMSKMDHLFFKDMEDELTDKEADYFQRYLTDYSIMRVVQLSNHLVEFYGITPDDVKDFLDTVLINRIAHAHEVMTGVVADMMLSEVFDNPTQTGGDE